MNDYRKLVNELDAIFEASDSAHASPTITKKSRQPGQIYTSSKNDVGDAFNNAQLQHDNNLRRDAQRDNASRAAMSKPSQLTQQLLNPYNGRYVKDDVIDNDTGDVFDKKSNIIAAQNGDVQALEKLRDKYSPLLYKLAKSSNLGGNMDIADLVQEANVGFLEAIDSYNTSSEADFSTWLITVVGGLLKNYMSSNMRGAVNVPRNEFNSMIPKFNKLVRQYEMQGIDEYSTKKGVMHDLEIDDKTYNKLKLNSATGTTSVHNTVPGMDSENTSYEDMLSTNQTLEDELMGLESGTITSLTPKELRGIILDLANAAELTDMERRIFYLAYGVSNNNDTDQAAISLDGIHKALGINKQTLHSQFNGPILKKVSRAISSNPELDWSQEEALDVLKKIQLQAAGDTKRAEKINSHVKGYINKDPKTSAEDTDEDEEIEDNSSKNSGKFRDKNREQRISGTKTSQTNDKDSLASKAEKYRNSDDARKATATKDAKATKSAGKKQTPKTRKIKPQAQIPKDSSK